MIYIYVFGGFPKWGTPKFHLLSEDFQDNPFVLGIPHISTVQEDPEVPDQFTRHACVWLKSSKNWRFMALGLLHSCCYHTFIGGSITPPPFSYILWPIYFSFSFLSDRFPVGDFAGPT